MIKSDSEEEEDIYYYRYSSSNPGQINSKLNTTNKGSLSLAPLKSTLYVSNLDYSLTNSDLYTLFLTFVCIAHVIVLKDRLSHGVTFIQFDSYHDVHTVATQMHRKVNNGHKLIDSISTNNSRVLELIHKCLYLDPTLRLPI
ncbi:U11/U12 small nuclear ribonucleoprotein 31 kDa protein [Spatholobus suberectus]|nr:U11/U12 small nuclear ribonucleoprotein 31 kDa protein [Spatholobus suberectus]